LKASSLAQASLPFETNLPGTFAGGDVRHGSGKRMAGAGGEGSVAAGSVHRYLAETVAAATTV
jgi:thioredoxin reductase (NADPH)